MTPTAIARVRFPERESDLALVFDRPHLPEGVRVVSRDALELAPRARLALSGYSAALPAGQWRAATVVETVDLGVELGAPARVRVVATDGTGAPRTIVESDAPAGAWTHRVDLTGFPDGGWCWVELEAGDVPVRASRIAWSTEAVPARHDATASLAITTLNRVPYCLDVLRALADEPALRGVVDAVYVVDQGTDHVRAADGFPEVAAALGDMLQLIEQANLGGSGGFSRGMHETLVAGRSDFVILLDDDIRLDPESILRAVAFASYCREPTVVGGHMLDIAHPTVVHSFAEGIEQRSFVWRSLTPLRHDLAESGLAETPWMHRVYRPDYSGWWMCLIPVDLVERIGYSMPFFIKWDDAEFGLRAQADGASVVSLPGVAAWHVAWANKDDTTDWQAFYHARNRLVTALLHARRRRGGSLWLHNLAIDLRYLLSMDYYAVALRHLAFEAVLAGPDALVAELGTRLRDIRALASEHPETRVRTEDELAPAREIAIGGAEPGRFGRVARFGGQLLRHLIARPGSGRPVRVTDGTARWWHIAAQDVIQTRTADGRAWVVRTRDRSAFRAAVRRSIRLNRAYRSRWDALAADFRADRFGVASRATWERIFADTARDA